MHRKKSKQADRKNTIVLLVISNARFSAHAYLVVPNMQLLLQSTMKR